jgi:hypothetical protein
MLLLKNNIQLGANLNIIQKYNRYLFNGQLDIKCCLLLNSTKIIIKSINHKKSSNIFYDSVGMINI